jgi:hypothetical protein
MDEERQPEEGLVPHAHGQRGHVLDSPVAKHLENVSRKNNRYSLKRWVALVLGYLGRVLHPGIYMQGSIARMASMIRRLGGSKMEDTDSKWMRAIVYNALIGHVDAVRILHSTWPSNTPGWRRYILTMTFRLAMTGSGWDLKSDTH